MFMVSHLVVFITILFLQKNSKKKSLTTHIGKSCYVIIMNKSKNTSPVRLVKGNEFENR